MNEEEDEAHEEADGTHHHVGDAQEGVLASQESGGGRMTLLVPENWTTG